MNELKFLQYVGSAERNSEHPLAEAIVSGIFKKNIKTPTEW
jgi:Cu+-exporting ATPase